MVSLIWFFCVCVQATVNVTTGIVVVVFVQFCGYKIKYHNTSSSSIIRLLKRLTTHTQY